MNEVKAAKHLGQHFLRDEAVIARLLAVINAKAGEAILEIGPGLGALTLPLLRQIGALTAVEYDPRVLAPLASGKISLGAGDFADWKNLTAIAVGIFVAWLAGRGVPLMMNQPAVVPGLIIGTVIGVAFLKGIPVGPLIAAGILSLFVGRGG